MSEDNAMEVMANAVEIMSNNIGSLVKTVVTLSSIDTIQGQRIEDLVKSLAMTDEMMRQQQERISVLTERVDVLSKSIEILNKSDHTIAQMLGLEPLEGQWVKKDGQ